MISLSVWAPKSWRKVPSEPVGDRHVYRNALQPFLSRRTISSAAIVRPVPASHCLGLPSVHDVHAAASKQADTVSEGGGGPRRRPGPVPLPPFVRSSGPDPGIGGRAAA